MICTKCGEECGYSFYHKEGKPVCNSCEAREKPDAYQCKCCGKWESLSRFMKETSLLHKKMEEGNCFSCAYWLDKLHCFKNPELYNGGTPTIDGGIHRILDPKGDTYQGEIPQRFLKSFQLVALEVMSYEGYEQLLSGICGRHWVE